MSRRPKRASTTLLLTQRSLADLRGIEKYSVGEWGRKVADKYLDDLETALEQIQQAPAILRREPEFSTGLYFYRVRKHILVCNLADDIVVVLTVLHTSMDLSTRLAELEPRLMIEAEYLHRKLREASGTDD